MYNFTIVHLQKYKLRGVSISIILNIYQNVAFNFLQIMQIIQLVLNIIYPYHGIHIRYIYIYIDSLRFVTDSNCYNFNLIKARLLSKL